MRARLSHAGARTPRPPSASEIAFMTKKMLIDAAHPEETRVVVVDGTRVEEFDFESQNRKQLRGNIYLAKVTRVEPSLQAAFVEYGGNRHGFLAFNEIHPDYYQIPVADREALMREAAEEDDDHPPARSRRGAKVAAPEGDEDEANEDGAESESRDDDDDMDEEVERRRRRLLRRYKIQEVIKRRQIMLVQVVKEERGNKGAALTTYLSLAGRYGVLMPNTARGGGISRKIEAAADRKRLKTIVQGLDVPQGMGLIIRTAGAKRTKLEIKRDYEYLMRAWEDIREKTMHSIAPALIYEEEGLVKRAIRDMYDKDLEGIWVEGDAGFREARDIMRMLMPSQAKKVMPYREATPLFVKHRVEEALSQIYSPNVPLKSGGYLVINQTEALVSVDVNSGRATRERNIEATALKTNMEAAVEACRQLRLRDLAGLIVIDFIDMDEAKNNRAVEKVLKDCLKEDRARVQMGKISSFGLMEISRQRRRSGVLESTTHACEHCQGTGRMRTVESAALSALRDLELEALKGGGEVTLKVSSDVGLYILNEKRAYLARVHQGHGLFVTITIDARMSVTEHEIERTVTGEAIHHAEPLVPLSAPAPDPTDDEPDFVDEDELEDDEEAIERENTDDDSASSRADRPARDAGREGGREEARRDEEGGSGRRRRRRRGRRDDREPREGAASEPRTAGDDAAGGPTLDADDSEEGHRRRRRGRRGGRHSGGREEGRPPEEFQWMRPRVPFGDDTYVWHDIAALETQARGGGEGRGPRPASADEASASAAQVLNTAEIAPVASFDGPQDIWVELPLESETAKPARRSRGGRGRGRAGSGGEAGEAAAAETAPVEAAAEAVAEATVEAPAVNETAVEAPTAKPARKSRAKKVVSVPVEAEIEPAVAVSPEPTPEPAPAIPTEPDPAEINAPPSKPRAGWWRRA
jgi:ribonuclease E